MAPFTLLTKTGWRPSIPPIGWRRRRKAPGRCSGPIRDAPGAWHLETGVNCPSFGFKPGSGTIQQIIIQDAPQGVKAVAPADLLAPGIGAAVVGDGHPENPSPQAGHLGRDFRLESKPVLP